MNIITNISQSYIRAGILVLAWLFMLFSQEVSAQQAFQFSQYFSNQLVLNPAYAGSEDALSVTMVHRNQWSGVQGAPKTTTLSGHTLFKNEHTGLGANLFVDKINIHSNVSFNGIYSYRIKTGSNSYLSLGLSAGINYHKSDYNALLPNIHNPNDPGIRFDQLTTSIFQFGTGAYFKSPRLELGVSAPILYSSYTGGDGENPELPSMEPHYFISGKYKIKVSPSLVLSPGFLIKSKKNWPLSYDINAEALLKEVLMVALSYRSFETLSTIVQMKLLPQMKFGYSYDVPLSNIQRRNFNSHEIMLNYIFRYKEYKVSSPR